MRTWIIVVALLVTPAPTFTQNVNVDSDRSVQTHQTRTLIVDVYDAHRTQLVWRGTGTDTSSDKRDPHTAKMDKAVAQMFEQYPPTQK
jgi:Domain of unknown function (DUF4136)